MKSDPPLSKKCTKCSTTKPLSSFSANSRYNDGYTYECKDCRNRYARERYVLTGKTGKLNAYRNDGLKECTSCKETKPLAAFGKARTGNQGVRAVCTVCRRIDDKAYASANKVRMSAKSKLASRLLKEELVRIYGGRCSCCGETQIEFLTLEHKKRNGSTERAVMTNHKIYKKAIANIDFDSYTILCMNCNFAERYGKTCPHKSFSLKVVA